MPSQKCLLDEITFETTRVQQNLDWPTAESKHHWFYTLKAPSGETMTGFFSMGTGYGGRPPTADEVLHDILSNARSVERFPEYKDWCSRQSYNPRHPEAKRIFDGSVKQARELKVLLGSHYNHLIKQD